MTLQAWQEQDPALPSQHSYFPVLPVRAVHFDPFSTWTLKKCSLRNFNMFHEMWIIWPLFQVFSLTFAWLKQGESRDHALTGWSLSPSRQHDFCRVIRAFCENYLKPTYKQWTGSFRNKSKEKLKISSLQYWESEQKRMIVSLIYWKHSPLYRHCAGQSHYLLFSRIFLFPFVLHRDWKVCRAGNFLLIWIFIIPHVSQLHMLLLNHNWNDTCKTNVRLSSLM